MSKLLPSFLHVHDASRAEVTARIAVVSLASFILSIADIPTVVPVSVSYGLGILGSCFAVAFPYMLYAIGLVSPILIAVFIYSVLLASALQAAATVSSGLLLGMYALGAWIITALYYGEDASKTSSMPGTIIALMGMFALSFRELVQNGLQFSVDEASLGNAPGYVTTALSSICQTQGLSQDCWQDSLPSIDPELEIQLPESAGILAGQMAYVTASNSTTLQVDIPGGLWIVKGLWTWSGLDNPLAANRNFLIAFSWSLLCWWLGVLLPPFRTARCSTSRALVPAVLMETAEIDTMEILDATKGPLIHNLQTMNGGNAAKLTIFEPRIFRAPTEFIVPQLTNLLVAAEQAVLGSCAVVVWLEGNETLKEIIDLQEILGVLNACANALESNEQAATEKLKQIKAETAERSPQAESLLDASDYIRTRCDKVLDATLAWLEALNHPKRPSPFSKEGSKNVLKTYIAWLLPPLLPFKRMVTLATLLVRPKDWNWISILWSLKLTAGFVALFAASIYTEFGDFKIQPSQGESGAVFAGWQLISFAFVTRPTVEGTVKKGMQRVVGTALGGFMAWLSIIVCSWSYDDDADINPYGLIAWLTITTTICGYFTIDPGDAAHKGAGYDHGYIGAYYVLAQSLIALEVYRNQGSKNAITVNRIVSNLAGIATAMVVGLIPPFVRGNDPKHAMDYLQAFQDAFMGLLALMVDDDEMILRRICSDDYQAGFLKDAAAKRELAARLLKDAGTLKFLPLFRQDERLVPLVEAMAVNEPILSHLLELAVAIVNEPDLIDEFTEGTVARQALQDIRHEHGDGMRTEQVQESGKSLVAVDNVALFVSLAQTISKRLLEHSVALSQID